MQSFVYFVPVDFSESALNALHFATTLAKNSGGEINVCHVIDLEDIPESDNPVVVSFALEREIKSAERKMKSLREIISMNGILVKEQILMGNVKVQLMKQIGTIKPGVIVLGRDTEKKIHNQGLLSFLVTKTSLPVLVIPKSHHHNTPSRAVLTSDITPKNKVRTSTLFEIIRKVSNELSLLNVRSNFFSNAHDALNYIQSLDTPEAKNLPHAPNPGLSGILEFIRSNKIDLHCAIRSTARVDFLGRFFNHNLISQLATREEIPVLFIKQ